MGKAHLSDPDIESQALDVLETTALVNVNGKQPGEGGDAQHADAVGGAAAQPGMLHGFWSTPLARCVATEPAAAAVTCER